MQLKSRDSNREFIYIWDLLSSAKNEADIYMPNSCQLHVKLHTCIRSDLVGSSGTISQPIWIQVINITNNFLRSNQHPKRLLEMLKCDHVCSHSISSICPPFLSVSIGLLPWVMAYSANILRGFYRQIDAYARTIL